MRFRSLRESRLLSQEKLAEMSGLSLRTIQRVEAGHRISFASLRALAVTLEIDVDQLERELYAMKQSTDDFVEVPRWVRLLTGGPWMGLAPLSRRQMNQMEAVSMAVGVVALVASFMVAKDSSVAGLRFLAGTSLLCGYLSSVTTRIIDAYKAWPAPVVLSDENAARKRRNAMALIALQVFLVGLIIVSAFLQEK